MRFDYHPPATRLKSFHLRRLLIKYLVITGLACIAFALFNQQTNVVDANVNSAPKQVKRPSILTKNPAKQPTLSLQTKIEEPTNSADSIIEPVSAVSGLTASTAMEVGREKWHTITVQVGDTLAKLFDKLGISKLTFNKFMSSGPKKDDLKKLYPGQKLDFLFDESKELKAVTLNLSRTKALHVTQEGNNFKYSYEERKSVKKVNFSSGKISGSLYSSAQDAGLDDSLIMQMADILGWDIDFTLDIRDNDSFKVLYEQEYIEDEKFRSGKILAVEFNNQGKLYKAVRYTDENCREGYYSPEGYSLQKAFLRSPVEFTRISSHFTSARRHPILHKIRSHKGVDYAAPTGTPVKSSGDGRISFMGTKGGYGKSIEITHGQKYSTFYAHLSRFNSKLKNGSFVKQGQIVGYVGKSGLATGPHLHYEFRINGVHHNPVTVSLPRSQPISTKNKRDFAKHADLVLSQLNTQYLLAKK